jgi:hypothetical protein
MWNVRSLGFLALLSLLTAVRALRADEPLGAHEPRLITESAEITAVPDAFDEGNVLDVNLVLGFTQSWKRASIRRESGASTPNAKSAALGMEDIASYSATTSALLVGADVGIYHDLALLVRLPVVLSFSQELGDLNGSTGALAQRLSDGTGGQLFGLPFRSPTRSGVDYISAGIDWAIFNQQRDRTKPSWVVGIEGRLAVGIPMHACNGGAAACPDPSNPTVGREPGISRGTEAILGKSIWSRRFGYLEPYAGVWMQAEFPRGGSDFSGYDPASDLRTGPPLHGSMALGLEVIPYEKREQVQRLSADVRLRGTYHSAGRDYSELFDALGSSQAATLRASTPVASGSGAPTQSPGNAYFTGITEEQAYGSLSLSASATWRSGEYIKFTVGSAFSYAQPHFVTSAPQCLPGNADPNAAGPCIDPTSRAVRGVPNPEHRDILDLPGRRFSVDDTTVVDLWVTSVVMF